MSGPGRRSHAERIDLCRGGPAIGTDRGHRFRLQRAVRIGAGHGLGAAAVCTEDGNVRHRQVETAVSRRVLLARLRQPVGAGRDDRLVVQRAVRIEVDLGEYRAAVGIDNGRIVLGPIAVRIADLRLGLNCFGQTIGARRGDDLALMLDIVSRIDTRSIGRKRDRLLKNRPIADIRLDRARTAVRAARRRPPISQRAVGIRVGNRFGQAAVRIADGHVGRGQIERPVAVFIALRRPRQAVGAERRDGLVAQ